VLGVERIAAIDTLRGVTVLGILLMNISALALPCAASFNPTVGATPAATSKCGRSIRVLRSQPRARRARVGAPVCVFPPLADKSPRSAVLEPENT
jgi:hypothetical protein